MSNSPKEPFSTLLKLRWLVEETALLLLIRDRQYLVLVLRYWCLGGYWYWYWYWNPKFPGIGIGIVIDHQQLSGIGIGIGIELWQLPGSGIGIGIDPSVLQYQYLLHDTKLVSKANLEVSNLTTDAIFWLHPLAPKQAMAAVKNPSEKGGTRRRSPVTYLLRCTHIAIKQQLLPLLLFLQLAVLRLLLMSWRKNPFNSPLRCQFNAAFFLNYGPW